MANVEKISVALTPELAAIVRKSVESGQYASTSEVVRDALRDWQDRQALRQQQIEYIGKLWDEGIASGSSPFEGVDAIIKEAKKELETRD